MVQPQSPAIDFDCSFSLQSHAPTPTLCSGDWFQDGTLDESATFMKSLRKLLGKRSTKSYVPSKFLPTQTNEEHTHRRNISYKFQRFSVQVIFGNLVSG